jgi:hypothetical protein
MSLVLDTSADAIVALGLRQLASLEYEVTAGGKELVSVSEC